MSAASAKTTTTAKTTTIRKPASRTAAKKTAAKTSKATGKTLVVVESPAKAKTIEKYLGSKYTVKASMGHLRDLPRSQFGIDVDHDFEPKYINIRGKGDIIKDLKKAADHADKVYLASDPDREGEAIAWHLAHILGLDPAEDCRIVFNEITKPAIQAAVKAPHPIEMERVDAQQARRLLDRIVGYQLSPLLWRKVKKGLSAGRVQSVTVKLIADREKEIEAFVSKEYWSVDLRLRRDKSPLFTAALCSVDGKRLDEKHDGDWTPVIPDEKTALKIKAELEKNADKLKVEEVKKTAVLRKAAPPFNTSSLQQDAARKLGDHHGLAGGKAQLSGGILLQAGGGKGRCRPAASLALFHLCHHPDTFGSHGRGTLRLLTAADAQPVALDRQHFLCLPGSRDKILSHDYQLGGELTALTLFQLQFDSPIFLGNKGLYGLFPVADQLDGNGLHPPGAKALAHLAPQQGAQLIAHNAVQHTPRLLGVHPVNINGVGLLDSRLYGRLGYFIKYNTAGAVDVNVKNMRQMPGNSLTLPVGVAGQIHPIRLSRILFQRLDQIPLAPDIDVLGRKIIFHVNAKLAFRQIPQVPHGSVDGISLSQIALYGLGLGRGLHQHQSAHLGGLFTPDLFPAACRLFNGFLFYCPDSLYWLCSLITRIIFIGLINIIIINIISCNCSRLFFLYLSFSLHLAHKTPSFTVRT